MFYHHTSKKQASFIERVITQLELVEKAVELSVVRRFFKNASLAKNGTKETHVVPFSKEVINTSHKIKVVFLMGGSTRYFHKMKKSRQFI